MKNRTKPLGVNGGAVEIFKAATDEVQQLTREILREERDVQHLQRRSDIHARIYEHIRRIIK